MKNLQKMQGIATCLGLLGLTFLTPVVADDCADKQQTGPECVQLELITIFGNADAALDVAGGASMITPKDLEKFETSNFVQALRQVPGVSVQLEDGWGLRPNVSIRGTATDRSSRVTLMEDSVLIAPAPYAAPAAYYFPTFGRIHAVEVLKGPASITQGPYTVGGAMNLVSTPVPDQDSGFLQGEYGSDSTWRVHGWYGGGNDRARYLAETYQWNSDGYQRIDRSDNSTGFSKQDYLAKLAFYSDPAATLYQRFEIKLQYSEEDSQQSYLGLTDDDFEQDELRRYGLSAIDEINTKHDQIALSWRLENQNGDGLSITGYHNDFERAWYKTESFDLNGSANPASFSGVSWSNIINAINTSQTLGGVTPGELQAILDGADTAAGSIQIRNNSREYYSEGVQLRGDMTLQTNSTTHELQAGLRYHQDEEDRLQRNDNYQQIGGQLLLNERGFEGNAGNEVNDAKAWAGYVHDRIEWGRWTFTPGLRYEDIKLSRKRYFTNTSDPSSRDEENFRDSRENHVTVWLPGVGALFDITAATRVVGGVHRGFATPGNAPGVDPEESINYELGLRHEQGWLGIEAMYFFNDYENLVGVCTNSSGGNCEPGDAFNGEGVHIPGLELSAHAVFNAGDAWQIPVQLAYTWMNATFQSTFNSDFFGQVREGDPVPYIPDNQLWVSIGLTGGSWSFYLGGNYVDSACTKATCGTFEQTESSTIFDLSAHYQINPQWELYAVLENLADQIYLVAREPYGARPNKPRSLMTGVKFSF
ncbi:MAG TPA: TonB-dependent receptor [Xanthomonadales bacterium]|nr:TonB-dependent receptor [Xanthomonadales bacterium]